MYWMSRQSEGILIEQLGGLTLLSRKVMSRFCALRINGKEGEVLIITIICSKFSIPKHLRIRLF